MRLAMASLETLPADQRAVLQMVLGRGRGYEEIGKMLSIDRAGVRDRALAALDALGPETSVPDLQRHLITDYLLGQLPAGVAEQTREHLSSSPTERAWARVVASELAPLASEPLPEIPSAPAETRRGQAALASSGKSLSFKERSRLSISRKSLPVPDILTTGMALTDMAVLTPIFSDRTSG